MKLDRDLLKGYATLAVILGLLTLLSHCAGGPDDLRCFGSGYTKECD